MRKLFTLLLATIFYMTVFANPIFADNRYGHGGRGGGYAGYSDRGYSGHGHSGHYIPGWEAAVIGLGAAVVGSAIINGYPREREVVVEHHTYYNSPPPPPQYRDDCYDCPRTYNPPTPSRVWVPEHYEYVGGGYYRVAPGHWE